MKSVITQITKTPEGYILGIEAHGQIVGSFWSKPGESVQDFLMRTSLEVLNIVIEKAKSEL